MKKFFEKYPAMRIFIALFILMCVAYIGYLVWYDANNKRNQKIYDDINEDVWEEETISDSSVSESEVVEQKSELEIFEETCVNPDLYLPYFAKKVNFSEYLEMNSDVIGFLEIPDTDIEYPVLRHPTEAQYYLKHNIDGSSGYPGCLFVETYNAADFSDAVTIIYGHNMKNDTMFGTLDVYKDEEFREEHPYFIVYTTKGMNIYEVSICSLYSTEHLLTENFEYIDEVWIFQSMTEHDQVDIYNKLVEYNASGNYVCDEAFTQDDKCVVLATCSGSNRFLVVGKMVVEVVY